VPRFGQAQGPALPLVRPQLRASLLGTRCDGPERSSHLRQAGNQETDRTRRVETLRGRQPGGAGIAPNDPPKVGRAMTRERLPNRRASISFDFEVEGLRYTATFSRFADDRIGELFLNNHKSNSAADTNARDSAIVFSFAVQHGADPEAI